jgi:hypothetical protein
VHELDARQAHLQTRAKPVLRQVAVDAIASHLQNSSPDRRSPNCAESFEQAGCSLM